MLEEFEIFCEEEKEWLDDYTLFMACKDFHCGASWQEWEKDIRQPLGRTKQLWREKLSKEISYYSFIQFIFQKQWFELREYAHEHDVAIIGDIPIFVAPDSADIWGNNKLFQLDTKGHPTHVAGVPA